MFIKKLIKFKFIIVGLIALIAISVTNMLIAYLFLPGNLSDEKEIIIKSKLSTHDISLLLAQQNVIKHPKLFEILAKIYSRYKPLKSGEYKFTRGISPYQVLNELSIGKSIIHKLFIPEGFTVNDIIEKLNSEERLAGKITSNIPEGYLMPSTYFYSYGDNRENLIEIMRNKMSQTLDEIMEKLPDNSLLKTRKDVLILASIVEKEAGNKEELGIIAAVFLNRLKIGMRLQADPTTIYAITNGKYKLMRSLTKEDLKIESLYNTYYVSGLPVGAISCPGKAALESVINPDKTNALYFVANGGNGHYFARNLEEHNINVQKYKLELRSKKKDSKPISHELEFDKAV